MRYLTFATTVLAPVVALGSFVNPRDSNANQHAVQARAVVANCTTAVYITVTPKPTTTTVTYTVTTTRIAISSSFSAGFQPARRFNAIRAVNNSTFTATTKNTLTPTTIPTTKTTPTTKSTSSPTSTSTLTTTISCKTTTLTTTLTTPTKTLTTTTTTTISATPTGPCKGQECGTYTKYPCPSSTPPSPLGDCLCGVDPQGNSFCFEDNWCDAEKDCSFNSDCGGGGSGSEKCVMKSCCSIGTVGKGKCVKVVAGGVCVNGNLPRWIFRSGRDRNGRRDGDENTGGLCSNSNPGACLGL